MLEACDIPRLAERLVINELWQTYDRLSRWDVLRELKPRHWTLLQYVWAASMRQRYTSANSLEDWTGLSHQQIGDKFADLRDARLIALNGRAHWYVTEEAMRVPAFPRNGQPAIIDQLVLATHNASAELTRLAALSEMDNGLSKTDNRLIQSTNKIIRPRFGS